MDTVRASWWLGTLNNPTVEDRQTISGPAPRWLRMIKGQDEVGESGTLHIQFAVNTQQIRLSQLKTWLPRAHFEVARNQNAVANYVNKSETAVPDTQFEYNYVTENANRTFAQVMRLLAENADVEKTNRILRTPDGSGRIPSPVEVYTREYWETVRTVLAQDENLVGLLTQPQYLTAWKNTRDVWLGLVAVDRQTDISVAYQSPRNEIVNL